MKMEEIDVNDNPNNNDENIFSVPMEREINNTQIFISEALGTSILVTFGLGSVAQTVLSTYLADKAVGEMPNLAQVAGGWSTICNSFGIGLAFAIYVSGGISGAHLNPAMSVALAVYGKFKWSKVPMYIAAQTFGAFFGALYVFIAYYDNFIKVNIWDQRTAGIFSSYPQNHIRQSAAFFNEFFGTALLAIGVFAVSDENNMPALHSTKPLAIGLLLNGIGLTFGYNTGFSINPARDFGPRLFTAFSGWGFDVFGYSTGYFWIPIIAPFLGAIVGGGFYYFFIEAPHKRKLIFDAKLRKLEKKNNKKKNKNYKMDHSEYVTLTSENM